MKKTVILFLIISILLILLISCGDSESEQNETPQGSPQEDSGIIENANGENVVEETPAEILPDLPEADFGGAVVTFLTAMPFDGATGWSSHRDLYAEADIGEPLNDAVFYRNVEVQEKYNFEMNIVGNGDPNGALRRSVRSGSEAYDMLITTFESIPALAFEGILTDLTQFPNIDLSKPWWDQNANESLNIAGRLYFTTGDITTQAIDATSVLLFNQTLAQDVGLENLYNYVRENKWTWDRLLEILKTPGIARDLNGDGVMGLEDQFALTSSSRLPDAMLYASGLRVTQNDANGIPQFVLNTPKTIALLDKAIEFMDDQITMNQTRYNEGWTLAESMFADNRVLFYAGFMQHFARLREMNDSFGLLPLPKWEESQDKYYHQVINVGGMMGIPTDISPERAGMVGHAVEALHARSRYTLIPAYFEITITNKLMRDEDSGEMLDIIINSRSFDIGFMRDWGRLYSTSFNRNAISGTANFASAYEAAKEAAVIARDNDMEAIFER